MSLYCSKNSCFHQDMKFREFSDQHLKTSQELMKGLERRLDRLVWSDLFWNQINIWININVIIHFYAETENRKYFWMFSELSLVLNKNWFFPLKKSYVGRRSQRNGSVYLKKTKHIYIYGYMQFFLIRIVFFTTCFIHFNKQICCCKTFSVF